MSEAPEYTLAATALLPDMAFIEMQKLIVDEAAEHEFPIVTNSAESVCCRTPIGDISAVNLVSGLRLEIRANTDSAVALLKGGILEHLAETHLEIAQQVRWSDARDAGGGVPKNFRYASVAGIEQLCKNFMRVTLQVSGLDSFVGEAIHFRLILLPAGLAEPEWPSVAPNGQTQWPKDEKALHRPVYTIRDMDLHTGKIMFDVFLHHGGRVTEWLKANPMGAPVGIMGPGGGGLLQSPRVFLFGDETAFPAIARILENLPHDASGIVVLATGDGSTDYPITAPSGIRLTWHHRETHRSLADIAIDLTHHQTDAFFWFAAEKEQVARVRSELSAAMKIRGQDSYISAYW